MKPGLRQDEDYSGLWARIDEWSEKGLRVLLFAFSPEMGAVDSDEPKLPSGLVPMGLLSMSDELRPRSAVDP